MHPWSCCRVSAVDGGRKLARPAWFAAVPGTTTRGTAVALAVTTTSPISVTTTWASVAPEFTTKPDGFGLNRPLSKASLRRRQNPKAPGVLVALCGRRADARRRAALAEE